MEFSGENGSSVSANVNVNTSSSSSISGNGEGQQNSNNGGQQALDNQSGQQSQGGQPQGQGQQFQGQQVQTDAGDAAFANFFNNFNTNYRPDNQQNQSFFTDNPAQNYQNGFSQIANNQVQNNQNQDNQYVQPTGASQSQNQEDQDIFKDLFKAPESSYINMSDDDLVDLSVDKPKEFLKAVEDRALNRLMSEFSPAVKKMFDETIKKSKAVSEENVKTYIKQQQQQQAAMKIIGDTRDALAQNGINMPDWQFQGFVNYIDQRVRPAYDSYISNYNAMKQAGLQIPQDKFPLNKDGSPLNGKDFIVRFALLTAKGTNPTVNNTTPNNNMVQTRPNVINGQAPTVQNSNGAKLAEFYKKNNIN